MRGVYFTYLYLHVSDLEGIIDDFLNNLQFLKKVCYLWSMTKRHFELILLK